MPSAAYCFCFARGLWAVYVGCVRCAHSWSEIECSSEPMSISYYFACFGRLGVRRRRFLRNSNFILPIYSICLYLLFHFGRSLSLSNKRRTAIHGKWQFWSNFPLFYGMSVVRRTCATMLRVSFLSLFICFCFVHFRFAHSILQCLRWAFAPCRCLIFLIFEHKSVLSTASVASSPVVSFVQRFPCYLEHTHENTIFFLYNCRIALKHWNEIQRPMVVDGKWWRI